MRTHTLLTALALGTLLWSLARAQEQDKNGVSPNSISRPTGPGSLEGLGDAFQPALNTGLARYSVELLMPPGVSGFTPSLTLDYDSGEGYGPLGIGWSFGPGCIRRQMDKGLPRYVDAGERPDRFIGMEGEELVPLKNGYYLAKVEGTYIRYKPIDEDGDGTFDYWEAHTKSGIKLEFGVTPEGCVSNETGTKIYRWCLERQADTNGNVIEYSYIKPDPADRQNYLDEIRYGPGPGPWQNFYSAKMTYEGPTADHEDSFTDYRSGYRVRTTRRLAQIDIKFNYTLIRRYVLGYDSPSFWSLLTSVTLVGSDGVSTLPTTTFGYSTFDLCDPDVPISAAEAVITSANSPNQVMDNPLVDLIDLNADGLPDVLQTGMGHTVYLNRGVTFDGEVDVVTWDGPLSVAAEDPRAVNFDLSQPGVHLADMTGDGVADLVAADTNNVEFFENTGTARWADGQLMSAQPIPPPPPFDPQNENVVTTDLDFDKRIDVILSQFSGYKLWLNQGQGIYSEPIITTGAWHNDQLVEFGEPGVHLADMNGDRLSDVVKIMSDCVAYCANMGYGQFDAAVEIPLPDRWIDVYPGGNIERASLQDVNADGLADLAVDRACGDDLWLWVNLGNDTFAESCTITDLPLSFDAVIRWADINGNGTTDLIYADSSLPGSKINAVDLGVLLAGTPYVNVMTSIDNGYGRSTAITYRSSTEHYLSAYAAGNPWTITLPFPTSVVSRTDVSIGLSLDTCADGPNGDVYTTDFVYRDGYYDPLEKQFRGFSFVKQIEKGDEECAQSTSPTLVTRYGFHTGAPDGFDNDDDGTTDEPGNTYIGREEEPLKGMELWRETTTWPDEVAYDGVPYPVELNDSVFQRIRSPLGPPGGTAWAIRNLCTATGGLLVDAMTVAAVPNAADYTTDDFYDREVRQAVRARVETDIIELASAPTKHLRVDTDQDVFGNETLNHNWGDLDISCEAPITTSCGTLPSLYCDDLHVKTEYVLDTTAEANWIVDCVARVVQRMGGEDGAFVSETRNYYDGDAFVGLGFGQMGAQGRLHRSEEFLGDGTAPTDVTNRSYIRGEPSSPTGSVDVLRSQFDDYGNPVVLRDANGNDRRLAYEQLLHTYPTTETIVVGGGSDDLVINATYDYRWGKPATMTDFNGHVTRFEYDEFGRFCEEYLPGDPDGSPTHRFTYNLWDGTGNPVNSITTTAHPSEGLSAGVDVITTQYFDGLGRKLTLFEHGGPVVREFTLYNTHGQPWKVFQPYTGQPVDADGHLQLPDQATPAYITSYDATNRALTVTTPPDADGVTATSRNEYEPLTVIEFDGEDNLAGSPHHNTPKTLVYDGLERLIEVHEIETLSAVDSGTFITRYRYTMPDLLAEIEDANCNIKYMRYDGLGRRIFMNDLNRGHMYYTYDAAGNLTETVDAKGQKIVYTYDGANRILSEDYLDCCPLCPPGASCCASAADEAPEYCTPLSFQRTPDIEYHYDQPSPDHPGLSNTNGQLSWVEDLSGAEHRGYNLRGTQEITVKEIEQIDGSSATYTTTTLVDNLGRVQRIIYPDGDSVLHRFNARGLLDAIPGFASPLTYTAAGQKHEVHFANSVTTNHTYDPRLRLRTLLTVSPAETLALQDLTYTYDQADNITSITDGRDSVLLPDPEQRPRSQTASFLMDNLYRLQQATGSGYGDGPGPSSINYDYDRIGNMEMKASPDINDPEVDIGDMYSGGEPCDGDAQCETAGRVGRGLSDPPGPHALTFSTNDIQQRAFDYDPNGNMINNDGDLYIFDIKDQLGRVEVEGQASPDIQYIYDHSGRRIAKRVDGNQTTYVDRYNEKRDGALVKHIWRGDQRLARVAALPPSTSAPEHSGGELYPRHTNTLAASEIGSPAIRGFPGDCDYDDDGDVDLNDLGAYLQCLSGPGTTQDPAPPFTIESCLAAFDTDCDDDIDVRDFASFQVRFAGSVHARPNAIYYHADHLGSTNIVTGSSGSPVSESINYPYGKLRLELVMDELHVAPSYQFCGKEHDQEAGFVHFGARFLLPSVGRFLSVDPVDSPGRSRLIRPMFNHLYCYAAGSPIRFTDPTGMYTEDNGIITIEDGDWLSTIAEEELGEPLRYDELYPTSETRQKYGDAFDPNHIEPGDTFYKLKKEEGSFLELLWEKKREAEKEISSAEYDLHGDKPWYVDALNLIGGWGNYKPGDAYKEQRMVLSKMRRLERAKERLKSIERDIEETEEAFRSQE